MEHAEAFLEKFEKDTWLREQLLRLHLNAALLAEHKLQDSTRAGEIYDKAVTYSDQFFRAGETHTAVRIALMQSYLRAAEHASEMNTARAGRLYLDGIACGELFIRNGEQNKQINALLLQLYLKSALSAPTASSVPYEYSATRFFNDGIAQAELILDPERPDAVLLEPALALYFHAALNNPADRQALLNKGIVWGNTFFEHIADAENLTTLRQYFLRLFVNAEASDTLHHGIEHAEQFIQAGEQHHKIYEYTLALLLNTAPLAEAAAGITLYDTAIAHGERFCRARQATPELQGIMLKLYLNAALHCQQKNQDPARAQAIYWSGISQARLWPEIWIDVAQENHLRLYLNASDNAAHHLHTRDLAHQLAQAGIEHGRTLLASGLDTSVLRALIMDLHALNTQLNVTPSAFKGAIEQSEAFFQHGETRLERYKQFLGLCLNSSHRIDDISKVRQFLLTGLSRSVHFLQSGNTDHELQQLFLRLCVRAAEYDQENSTTHCATGIQHAETFGRPADYPPALGELTLRLYLHAGLAQQEDAPERAQGWWYSGIEYGQEALKHEDVLPTSRQYLQQMQLLVGLNDAACEADLETRRSNRQMALRVIKNRQREGRLTPDLYEQVLQLYADAADSEISAFNIQAAQNLYHEAIAQGALFLKDPQASTTVSLQILRFYYEAGMHTTDPETAQQYYLKGIAHARVISTKEQHPEIQTSLLDLYHNAALNASNVLGD
ncbi:MAG: hypothetical protein AAF512_22870, partial [Pseudomonadota bacterium]